MLGAVLAMTPTIASCSRPDLINHTGQTGTTYVNARAASVASMLTEIDVDSVMLDDDKYR